jgi:hypothetical protein
VSREAVVELIRATTTKAGLRVRAKLDTRTYETKKVVPKEQLARVRIHRARFPAIGTTPCEARNGSGNFDRAP